MIINNRKIFLSGKITGEPIYETIYKFFHAQNDMYRKFGRSTELIDPFTIKGIHFGISHKEAMKLCFEQLKDCTHIYMLKCWKDSKGAKMEHEFAKDNDINIIYQK